LIKEFDIKDIIFIIKLDITRKVLPLIIRSILLKYCGKNEEEDLKYELYE